MAACFSQGPTAITFASILTRAKNAAEYEDQLTPWGIKRTLCQVFNPAAHPFTTFTHPSHAQRYAKACSLLIHTLFLFNICYIAEDGSRP